MPSKRKQPSFPVVGIDIDGCLADTNAGWKRYYGYNHCGNDHADFPENHNWDSWKKLCSGCWNEVLHNREIVLSLPVMTNARANLIKLSAEYRLIVVTSRGTDIGRYTIEWIRMHGLAPFIETVIHYDDKPAILEHYEAIAHLDDAPKKLLELQADSSTVVPIAFDQPYNQDFSGKRIYSWNELATVLEDIKNPHLEKQYA